MWARRRRRDMAWQFVGSPCGQGRIRERAAKTSCSANDAGTHSVGLSSETEGRERERRVRGVLQALCCLTVLARLHALKRCLAAHIEKSHIFY